MANIVFEIFPRNPVNDFVDFEGRFGPFISYEIAFEYARTLAKEYDTYRFVTITSEWVHETADLGYNEEYFNWTKNDRICNRINFDSEGNQLDPTTNLINEIENLRIK